MSEPVVLQRREGAVLHLGLNRPQVRNAMNTALVLALREVLAAAERDDGVRVIVLRLLMPLQAAGMAQALAGVQRVMVVEQNHEGQLLRYLKGVARLPGDPAGFHRPGPLPLRPADICTALVDWAAAKEETK